MAVEVLLGVNEAQRFPSLQRQAPSARYNVLRSVCRREASERTRGTDGSAHRLRPLSQPDGAAALQDEPPMD